MMVTNRLCFPNIMQNNLTRITSKYEVRYVVFGTFLIYIDNGYQFFESMDELTFLYLN